MFATSKARAHSLTRRLGLGLLLAVLLLALGVGAWANGSSGTDQVEVSGILGPEDGAIVVDDGSASYGLVSGMELAPFLGKAAVVNGRVDGRTLYVRGVTVGAVHLEVQPGTVEFQTTGRVEQTTDGFQVSAEGIAFSLVGSDDLNQVAGQTADITGALNGTEVTLTSLITSDGQVVATSGSVEDTADWSDLVSPDTPSNNDALLDD